MRVPVGPNGFIREKRKNKQISHEQLLMNAVCSRDSSAAKYILDRVGNTMYNKP
jgi:hypothetical protein